MLVSGDPARPRHVTDRGVASRPAGSHVLSLRTPGGVVCRRRASVVGDGVNAIWTVTGGGQDGRARRPHTQSH